MKQEELVIRTGRRSEMVEITARVAERLRAWSVADGVCLVFCPHTTAGLTLNENADPDVRRDMLQKLERLIPWNEDYRHAEGNSAAHIKASLFGHSLQIPVRQGRLQLGVWQGIYLCEFDGPRSRRVLVSVVEA
jgi:secondary thiamine-phosphate synthase enzyme